MSGLFYALWKSYKKGILYLENHYNKNNMKKIIAITFAFLLTLNLNAQTNSAYDLIEEGIELFDRGDFEGALEKYDEALEIEENNLGAMSEKANTLVALGRYKEAVKLCKFLIKESPDKRFDLRLDYTTYGTALDLMGKGKKAVKIYNKGIKKFPGYYLLHYNKAIALSGLNKYEDAIEAFQASVKVNPIHASSHNGIARVSYSVDKIPSILALGCFLVIEPTGQRAEQNLELLEMLLSSGIKRNDDGSTTIFLNTDNISDKKRENDFSMVEMILNMSAALDVDESNKEKTKQQLFTEKFETLFSMIEEQVETNYGFYWEFYGPYYSELHAKEYTEVFSYIIASSSGDKEVTDWLEANGDKVDEFNSWSSTYNWNMD